MLQLRLGLLDSFCTPTTTKSIKDHFVSGRFVIIDLSDPFLDESAACTLFDIVLGLFLEADIGTNGKVIGEQSHFSA